MFLTAPTFVSLLISITLLSLCPKDLFKQLHHSLSEQVPIFFIFSPKCSKLFGYHVIGFPDSLMSHFTSPELYLTCYYYFQLWCPKQNEHFQIDLTKVVNLL